MPIAFATTNPARLTGTVGKNGMNRPHDVALVQVLLGETREKGAQTYLKDYVTGKLDPYTLDALGRFCIACGERNPNRNIGDGGPVFQRLASGKSFAVAQNTITPYQVKRAVPPAQIRLGPKITLTNDETQKLQQIAKDMARTWGLAFSLRIEGHKTNTNILICHFEPVGCSIHAKGRWCKSINSSSSSVLRSNDPVLHGALANEVKARASATFGITEPEDMAVNRILGKDMATVIRPDVSGALLKAERLLKSGRAMNLDPCLSG